VAANVGFEGFDARAVLAGFLLEFVRGFFGFVVIEDYVRAGLGEEFYGGGANAARTASDKSCLACQ
jgi:hypothetical protein